VAADPHSERRRPGAALHLAGRRPRRRGDRCRCPRWRGPCST